MKEVGEQKHSKSKNEICHKYSIPNSTLSTIVGGRDKMEKREGERERERERERKREREGERERERERERALKQPTFLPPCVCLSVSL